MKHIIKSLARMGRGPDTELLHVSKNEIKALHGLASLMGGKLTKNPKTGLTEAGFFDKVASAITGGSVGGGSGAGFSWGQGLKKAAIAPFSYAVGVDPFSGDAEAFGRARDRLETAGVLAGNYMLPGSSLLTSRLASKGSQKQLGSDIGKLAQLGTGIAGGVQGNMSNYPGMGETPAAATPSTPAYDPLAGTGYGTPGGVADPLAGTGYAGGMPAEGSAIMGNAAAPSVTPTPWYNQAGNWALKNPMLTVGGIGLASQALAPKPEEQKPHDVYFAGQSTPGTNYIPQAPRTDYSDTSERMYFANNNPYDYTSAPGETVKRFAPGGILNLRPHGKAMNPMFIQGAGDGMSDSVPAYIDGAGKRPHEQIKVADGEYILSSDVVSALGGGSSNAGAKKLDKLVNNIRSKAHGTTKQIKPIGLSVKRRAV